MEDLKLITIESCSQKKNNKGKRKTETANYNN